MEKLSLADAIAALAQSESPDEWKRYCELAPSFVSGDTPEICARKLIRVSISRYDPSLRWVNGGNLFEEAVALEAKFREAFRKGWKAGRYSVRGYGTDLAEVTIPENVVRDGAKLKLHSSREEIELRSGQVLQGIHVVIATPQDAADPTVIGRKPGQESRKDLVCRAALAVLDNDASRPPKRRGRRAQLATMVRDRFPDYKVNSIGKMIRKTVADWERRHPDK